jgi:hypothetical protein
MEVIRSMTQDPSKVKKYSKLTRFTDNHGIEMISGSAPAVTSKATK